MRRQDGRGREPARARVRHVAAGIIAALLATPLACGGESPVAPRKPALEVTAVIPSAGRISGGTPVTVTGLGFRPGATVTIDGVAATDVQVVNRISITAVAPAGRALGAVTVAVTNPDGRRVELPLRFRYVPDDDGPAGPWDY